MGLNQCLMAYRHHTIPHDRCESAELMYGRKVRTKIPELSEISSNLEVQDRDNEMKQKYKDYADERKYARDSDVQARNRVLLQQQKRDKLSRRFEAVPYTVLERHGSQITMPVP